LILTQEQCDVCAVNEAVVRRAAKCLKTAAVVESVNPTSLAGVFSMFRRVGELLGAVEAANRLIDQFEETAREITRLEANGEGAGVGQRPRVLLLEWLDPPYSSGHWNPEIIALAGGVEVLGEAGAKSRRVTWDQVALSRPDVIIVSPCGFELPRTLDELGTLAALREWTDLEAVKAGRVVAVDGSAYFSRPGPRLLASLRMAAAAIDPERCGCLAPPETSGWRIAPIPIY
jgi:iron complex transport system substrate-binding protein